MIKYFLNIMNALSVICGIKSNMIDFWKRVRALYTQDLNQAWLCRKLGVSSGTFSNWITRDSIPKANTAQAIAEALGVSVEYLVTGKELYLEDLSQHRRLRHNAQDTAFLMDHRESRYSQGCIPFYGVDLTYSNMQQIQDQRIKPTENLMYTPFGECDFCIRVVGSSMEPHVFHGDIVALQKVQGLRAVLWGEIYVIVTFEESKICAIKSLFQDPENPNTIILRSLNSSYPSDNVLPKSSIKDVYKVVGSIRQFG